MCRIESFFKNIFEFVINLFRIWGYYSSCSEEISPGMWWRCESTLFFKQEQTKNSIRKNT